MSQPALTSRLHRMEADLGVKLFERGAKSVEETAEGEALCEYARRVLDAHEEAQMRVREARFGFGAQLRLGTTQLAIHQVVVPSLRVFRTSFPEAHLSLSEGTSHELERSLEHGALDVAFLHPPIHAPGLAQKVLTGTHVVLADCAGGWSPGDDVVRYPRREAPVMMGGLERRIDTGDDAPTGSKAEANTALTSLALSAGGYGAAFVTEDLPDFGFNLERARSAERLIALETAVVTRALDRRPAVKALLGSVNDAMTRRENARTASPRVSKR